MIIRIRTQAGTWRVENLRSTSTFREVRQIISEQHNVNVEDTRQVHSNDTIGGLNMKHGDMLYLHLNDSMAELIHEEAKGKKKIGPDGAIVQQSYEEISRTKGFRPGRLSLRDIKMNWTLADFIAMDDQYTFKIKRQDKAICSGVSLDSSTCNSFQSYVRQLGFQQSRVGYLYGKVEKDTQKVHVESIYEPLQDSSAAGFVFLDDPNEETADTLASYLGLERVGWIFAHPPREEGFLFNSAEIITAAELQLIAADGVQDHPFVTVKVTVDSNGDAHFDAYQVSKQCMEMVAEDAIQISDNPAYCKVKQSFSCIVEAKSVDEVDNNFFLTVVPIEQHESHLLVNMFPPCNRHGTVQTWKDVKNQLSKAGTKGFSYLDMLSDLHLLLFLTQFLDLRCDLPKICQSIVDREIPLDEGFKLIINQMAGMDS